MDDADVMLFEEGLRRRRVIPYLGAGLGLACSPQLPGWRELLDVLGAPTDRDLEVTHRADLLALDGVDLVAAVREELARLSPPPSGAHRALLRLEWPAVLTTNWDTLAEEAWAEAASGGDTVDAVRGEANKLARALPLRFRRDAQRFLAELQAGLRPGPLLKLHGDLNAGADEFVFTHSQYRRLVARDIDLQAVLAHVLSSYSLLFYGTSLTDPDLLGMMDDLHERLGHAAGPHFHLTADPVSEARRRFLRERYSIRTLRYPSWPAALCDLTERAERALGWRRADSPDHVELGVSGWSVRLHSSPLPSPPFTRPVAASAALRHDGRPRTIGATVSALQLADALSELSDVEAGSAVDLGAHRWALFGQLRSGWGRPDLVRLAVLSMLRGCAAAGEHELHIPLPASGRQGLTRRLSLLCTLHAIGEASRHGAPTRVHIHAPPVDQQEDVVNAVAAGVIDAWGSLRRGREGRLNVHVVYPSERPEGEPAWQVQTLTLPADATLSALAAALPGFPRRRDALRLRLEQSLENAHTELSWRDDAPLLALGAVDGVVLTVEA